MRSLFCISIIVLISCGSFKGLPGKYVKKGRDYKYTLTINEDNTFNLVNQSVYARSGCNGTWKLTGDTLLLQCGEEPFPAQIASGYMNERERKVIVLSEKKLKLGDEVLKRASK